MSAQHGPTVAVVHPVDPGRPTVIPATMFDPEVHTLWDERDTGSPTPDELPTELPGRKALLEAGLKTITQVRAVRDFGQIPGIGEKTEERLVAWLAGDGE